MYENAPPAQLVPMGKEMKEIYSLYYDAECIICGNEFFAEKDYHKFGICECCSRKIGRMYSFAHSGATSGIFYEEGDNLPTPRKRRRKISSSIRKNILEKYMYRCVQCNDHRDLCIDHIHPVCLGGGNDAGNLQVLCRSCNSIKGGRA